MHRSIKSRLSASFIAGLLLAGCAAGTSTASDRVTVRAIPVPLSVYKNNKSDRAGQLRYISGLELKGNHADFGGISGFVLDKTGQRFIAVTDKGRYIKGSLAESAPGKLTGVRGVKIDQLSGLHGGLKGKKEQDSESIIDLSDGSLTGPFLISFERDHRILQYRQLGQTAERALSLPPADVWVPNNGGMEAIVELADGRIMALTEDAQDAAGNIIGWIADGPQALALSLRKVDTFKPTDMARLPNGDILVLERSFSRAAGVGMLIRRIPSTAIKPGVLLDGPVLARLNNSSNIDNMEGLAVRVTDDGRSLLYVISDDNFNAMQRTLLLVFEINN